MALKRKRPGFSPATPGIVVQVIRRGCIFPWFHPFVLGFSVSSSRVAGCFSPACEPEGPVWHLLWWEWMMSGTNSRCSCSFPLLSLDKMHLLHWVIYTLGVYMYHLSTPNIHTCICILILILLKYSCAHKFAYPLQNLQNVNKRGH